MTARIAITIIITVGGIILAPMLFDNPEAWVAAAFGVALLALWTGHKLDKRGV